MDDSDFSFASHVDLDDLEKTQPQQLDTGAQKEIVAGVHWRHRKLSAIVSKWRLQIKSKQTAHIREVQLLNLVVRSSVKQCFEKWCRRARINQRLHALGEKLRVGRCFSLWNLTLERGLDRRKTFLRFLLIRRSIYQRRFMSTWRTVYNLKLKLGAAAKQADRKLGAVVVKVFMLLIEKRRHEQALSDEVASARAFRMTKVGFERWRVRLFHRRLTSVLTQRRNYRTVYNRFTFWRHMLLVSDVRKERRDAVQSIANKFAMRLMFNRWYRRFDKETALDHSETELVRLCRRRALGKHYTKWVSKFRVQEYLHRCRDEFLTQRTTFLLTKSFAKWHDLYSSLSSKYEAATGSAALYNERHLRRCLHKWSRRCRQSRYDRRMTRRVTRKLRVLRVRRLFGRWEDHFKIHRDHRLKSAKAGKFRMLSLEVKAFLSWKNWSRSRTSKKSAEELADEHYILHLQQTAMRCWKILHVQSIRRYVMITSVLQTWAHRIQRRVIFAWRRYNEQKLLMRFYSQKACQLYHERRMSIAFAAFIATAQQIPFVPNLEDEDPILISDLSDTPLRVSEPTISTLGKPKCPHFLTVRRLKSRSNQ